MSKGYIRKHLCFEIIFHYLRDYLKVQSIRMGFQYKNLLLDVYSFYLLSI